MTGLALANSEQLSATMLGDQAVKPKKSLLGISRKRKTVVFSEPTYVDYSDIEYSTDEEDIEELLGAEGAQDGQTAEEKSEAAEGETEAAKVERKVADTANGGLTSKTAVDASVTVEPAAKAQSTIKEVQPTDSDDEAMNDSFEGNSRSRNGTVRNTDSFFRDSSETKKLTLTPAMLRDSEGSENGTREVKQRTSLDKLEKELTPDKEREKEKRKSRDKKPSAIRSFFSRKDKKRTTDDDDESFGKRSMDIMSESQEGDDVPEEPNSPERNQRKLQKTQPGRSATASQAQKQTVELSSYLQEGRTNDVSSVPPASMRIIDPETQEARSVPSNQQQQTVKEASPNGLEPSSAASSAKSALSRIVPRRSPSGSSDVKPQRTTKAKTRMELEVSSESEAEPNTNVVVHSPPSSIDGDGERIKTVENHTPSKDTAGSSVHTSPSNTSNPPALVADTSSAEGRSPEASPSPEPSQSNKGSTKEPRWDDGKLRSFFDDGDHVRDLLAVVYDKNDIGSVGMDHPAGGLFREQNAKLAEITTQLDNLLGDWMARKQRSRGRG